MAEIKKKSEVPTVDQPWNIFRLRPPEGEMMSVMKGNKDGPLDQIIHSVLGWHFKGEEPGFASKNEWDRWELVEDSETGYTPPTKNMPDQEFGIIVVGLFRALYIPHLKYTKWELKEGEKETNTDMVRKDRSTKPFYYFQYPIGIPVLEVESVGNFKTTIRMNVVVRLVNPYKAMHLAGGWEGLLDAAVHGAVREHIGPLTVDQIKKEEESGGLTKRILKLNSRKDGFKKRFGVELLEVRFVGFDTVSPDARVQKALEEEEINRLMANAAKEKAREIMTIAKAEADAAALAVSAYGSGEAAAAVRQAELLKEALVGANASVISLGGGTPLAVNIPMKK